MQCFVCHGSDSALACLAPQLGHILLAVCALTISSHDLLLPDCTDLHSVKPSSQWFASTRELVTATKVTNSHVHICCLCLFARIEKFYILANARSNYLVNDYSRVIVTNCEPGLSVYIIHGGTCLI